MWLRHEPAAASGFASLQEPAPDALLRRRMSARSICRPRRRLPVTSSSSSIRVRLRVQLPVPGYCSKPAPLYPYRRSAIRPVSLKTHSHRLRVLPLSPRQGIRCYTFDAAMDGYGIGQQHSLAPNSGHRHICRMAPSETCINGAPNWSHRCDATSLVRRLTYLEHERLRQRVGVAVRYISTRRYQLFRTLSRQRMARRLTPRGKKAIAASNNGRRAQK